MSIVVSILLIIAALFMIVTVLLQSSEDGGISAISGQSSSNSYFSKAKSKTMEARLALGTKIAAGVFVALSLVMLLINK